MKRTYISPLILISLFYWSIWGCSIKPESQGELDVIYVFADSLDWLDFNEPLNSVFGKEYKTPILEREYLLRWISFKQFEKYKCYRNVFFLGRLDSKEPVSDVVVNLLSAPIIEGIKNGDYFYIPKSDVWALDQYVLFLIAPTRDDMIQRIYDLGELIYEDFERSYYTRLKNRIFERFENKKLEEYLLAHFPFTLRIQHDYFIADESLEDNYVWIRRLNPDRSVDRSLLVHWVPYDGSIKIHPSWIVEERNRIAAKVYEGDLIVESETTGQPIRFLRWSAYRMEGTWKNPRYVVGGPFRNITFVDKQSNLIFMIDFYVQAVGKRKKPYLDQLEIMAHTFQSKANLRDQISKLE